MGRAGVEAWVKSALPHETITLYFLGDDTAEGLTENSIKLVPSADDTHERFQLSMTEKTLTSFILGL